MADERRYELMLDMNVLNHLGIGLYSSTPAVVTEIIANAWDADATEVTIDIKPESDEIIVSDNGHGMDAADLQEKFLRVGYARRDQEDGRESPIHKRRVMGRKGIGKLAMFSLARDIELWTKRAGGPAISARIDVDELMSRIKARATYLLDEPKVAYDWTGGPGTRIRLSRLRTGVDKTEAYLRPRIARRFSVVGKGSFGVVLNRVPITDRDRQFQKDVQFFWYFDDASRDDLLPLTSRLAVDKNGNQCIARINGAIDPERPDFILRGVIATVDRPKKLMARDAKINQISLFARGRLFQEDLLGELGNSQVFNSYVIGEVHADFLDDDAVDRSTASREAVKHGDELVVRVRSCLAGVMKEISSQWDTWRREIGEAIDDQAADAALRASATSLL